MTRETRIISEGENSVIDTHVPQARDNKFKSYRSHIGTRLPMHAKSG